MIRLYALALCACLCACAPAETPAVLMQTPGAAVMVDGSRYANAAFSVAVPAGWRVITSPADSAPAVTFAAPDNCAVIHLSSVPADAPTAPACAQPTQTLTREIALDGQMIYAAGSAPMDAWAAFTDHMERIAASLRPSASAAQIGGTLIHAGRERTYTVYIPASYTGDASAPLVIGLHGGSADDFARASNLNAAADEHGFIAAYPHAVGNGWNDGRRAILQIAYRERVDDVGFLVALIDALSAQFNVDRVYIAGISSGGMMSYRFACDMADRLDGFMAIAAAVPDAVYDSCAPSRPVPALIIVADADPVMPYAGGTIGQGSRRGDYGSVVSAAQTLDLWTAVNDCAAELSESPLPDSADDGTRVYVTTVEGCAAPVRFYRVENGGHGYPGGEIDGSMTQDVSATDLFIDFFGL
jgi:polyhydroxybutyrate depolymerase